MKRKVAVFKRAYNLSGLQIFPGEQFAVGPGYGELTVDFEGYLVLFAGEFAPHRVHPDNFDLIDVEEEEKR